MRPVKGLAQRVQRAGPDVAVHHPERQQRETGEIATPGAGVRAGHVGVFRCCRGAHCGGTLRRALQKGQRITKPEAPTALTRNAVAPLPRWKMTPSAIPPTSAATPVSAW